MKVMSNMRLTTQKIFFTLALLVLLIVPACSHAYSIELVEGDVLRGDFQVSPTKVALSDLKPGELTSFDIAITNRLGYNARFVMGAEDIVGVDDDEGYVRLLGDQEGAYSLKDLIKSEDIVINVGSGQRAIVPITIDVPGDINNKGLYGAVTITLAGDGATGSNGNVNLRSRIAVAVLATGGKDLPTSGRLLDFGLLGGGHISPSSTLDLKVVYENTGDVHTSPRGVIAVKNMFGNTLGNSRVEEWVVLPKSTRTTLTQVDTGAHFGKYSLNLELTDNQGSVIGSGSIVIWILPWATLIYVLLAIALAYILTRILARRWPRFISKDDDIGMDI